MKVRKNGILRIISKFSLWAWSDLFISEMWKLFEKYNLCVGTVIDENWILTTATCCKADDIVSISFNDYSIFIADKNQKEIISTRFHIHEDLDACLIRTNDIPETVTHIPCLTKVSPLKIPPIFRFSSIISWIWFSTITW